MIFYPPGPPNIWLLATPLCATSPVLFSSPRAAVSFEFGLCLCGRVDNSMLCFLKVNLLVENHSDDEFWVFHIVWIPVLRVKKESGISIITSSICLIGRSSANKSQQLILNVILMSIFVWMTTVAKSSYTQNMSKWNQTRRCLQICYVELLTFNEFHFNSKTITD